MPGVVLLSVDASLSRQVFWALEQAFPGTQAIFAPRSVGGWSRLRRRVRKRGWVAAIGEVGFRWINLRLLRRSGRRLAAIREAAGLCDDPVPPGRCHAVPAINAAGTLALVARLAPEAIVVFGTDKLTPATLAALGHVPVINFHPGMLPRYRGVQTGYWALRQGDRAGFGTTVHLVDEGLDTGPIVATVRAEPGPGDTVATYTAVLVAAGLPALVEAVRAALDGRLEARAEGPPGPLRLDPTLWSYLAGGLFRGVW